MTRPSEIAATLWDTLGRPSSADGFTFVVALVELHGPTTRPVPLRGYVPASWGHCSRCPSYGWDIATEVIWLRARLARLFGYTPIRVLPLMDIDPWLLDVGLVAVSHGDNAAATPFVLRARSDWKAEVQFSSETSDAERARIATAFSELLLAAPDDVQSFDDYAWWEAVDDEPASFVVRYGFHDGEPYEERYEYWQAWGREGEAEASVWDDEHPPGRLVRRRPCRECGGTGIDPCYLSRDCVECEGLGIHEGRGLAIGYPLAQRFGFYPA